MNAEWRSPFLNFDPFNKASVAGVQKGSKSRQRWCWDERFRTAGSYLQLLPHNQTFQTDRYVLISFYNKKQHKKSDD